MTDTSLKNKKIVIEDKVIADCLEALIGGIYLDKGFNLTEKLIKEMIGLNDPTEILNLLEYVIEGKISKSLENLNLLYDNGGDPSLILKDLIINIHQIGMIKVGASDGIKESLTESEFLILDNIASKLEISSISIVWQMLNKGLIDVNESFSPISSLEMWLIRIIYLNDIPNPDELIANLSKEMSSLDNLNKSDMDNNEDAINPKIKEIIDFFPGAEIEKIE